MLSIAQCTDSFLPVTDGVARVAYEYACALGGRGHECYVVTPQVNAGYRGAYPFEIVDFVAVQRRAFTQYRAGAAALDLHYLARADALRLDVVHSHSPGVAGIEAARLAERLHVPLVGTFHPRYFDDFFGGDFNALSATAHFVLDYYDRCDEVWTGNAESKELLSRMGVTCNIEVFETGTHVDRVPRDQIAAVTAALHIDERPVLLCVGSLERSKDFSSVLDAAVLLMQSGTPFQLLFVGSGPEEERLRPEIFRRGLGGRVRLLGPVADPAALDALYACAAVNLFPWTSVSVGLPVCEAAGQHTPSLVLMNTPSALNIRSGVDGIVTSGEPAAIASALQAALADPAHIEEMGRRAAGSIPVTWPQVADRVIARYEALSGMDRARLVRKRGWFRRERQQVDQSLQLRTADLIRKFLMQDVQHVYAYPYRPTKPDCAPVAEPQPLPRSTPEEQGVSSARITALIDAIQSDPEADAHAVMILRHGHVIAEGAWAPYSAAYPHQLYSLSKSVTSTAIGMLVDEGRLSLDETLSELFSSDAPDENTYPACSLTVRHLLNMSTGSLFNEVGTALGADWVGEFLRADVKFPAGSAFDYNSLNTYMLACIVRRKTGETLTEYLTPRLYEPLGIPVYPWETAPDGTEKGGWGLSLTIESVAKLGQLYLNGGRWVVDGEVRQLLSGAWIAEATRSQIDTPQGEITFGYGYQMWMTSHPGAFLFNGAFGQYMLALPDADVVVALFSGTSRLFAQGGVMDYVDTAFSGVSDEKLSDDPAAFDALGNTCAALSMRYRAPFFDPTRTPVRFDALVERLDNRVYTFDDNIAGLLPIILMSVENNYASGLRYAAFRRDEGGLLRIELSGGGCVHTLRVGERGYTPSVLSVRGDAYAVETGCQTEALGNGEWALHLNVHFVETPFARLLHFLFRGDAVTLVLDESPSVQAASEMLLTLAGITRQQLFRLLMPLLKRDQLQHLLKTFTTTTLQGKL